MNKTRRSGGPSAKKPTGTGGKAAAPQSRKSFWLRLAADVIIAAVILAVFYLFLEVLPQYRQFQKVKAAMAAEATATEEEVSREPEAAAEISFDGGENQPGEQAEADAGTSGQEDSGAAQAAEIEAAETFEEDSSADISGLTWKERFAEFFTEETEKHSNSYTSPNISIQITTVKDEEHGAQSFTAYVADIHVANIRNLQAGFPGGHRTAASESIARENKAVLAVNGDYYLNINNGLIVRNGVVLQESDGTADICVLYEDGTMRTYAPGEYSSEAILNQHPYQVWCFGPELLDEDGMPREEFNTTSFIYNRNPRTAIGYYEPGHYCLVVIDGRAMGNSNGASMRALSAFMADLGCSVAYNLDGGGSSSMVFSGKIINNPSDFNRKISDLVMICELPEPEPEVEKEPESEQQPEREPEAGQEREAAPEETAAEEEGQSES